MRGGGAGGRLELEDMARARLGLRFDSVDPNQPMLDLAVQREQSAGVAGYRVALHGGYVQTAPAGGCLTALRVCWLFAVCGTSSVYHGGVTLWDTVLRKQLSQDAHMQ